MVEVDTPDGVSLEPPSSLPPPEQGNEKRETGQGGEGSTVSPESRGRGRVTTDVYDVVTASQGLKAETAKRDERKIQKTNPDCLHSTVCCTRL